MREPGGLPSMGSHRVRHDWSDLAAAAAETRTSSLGERLFVSFVKQIPSLVFFYATHSTLSWSLNYIVCGTREEMVSRISLIWVVSSIGIRTGSSRHTILATFLYLPKRLTLVSKAKKRFHCLCALLDLNSPGYSSLQEVFIGMETVRNTNIVQSVLEGS